MRAKPLVTPIPNPPLSLTPCRRLRLRSRSASRGASPLALGDLVPLPEAPVEPAPAAPLRAGGNQKTEALAPDPGTIPTDAASTESGVVPLPVGRAELGAGSFLAGHGAPDVT